MQQRLTITFLGTGTSSGVPMIACDCAVCSSQNVKDKRLRSSIRVASANTTLVVDTTPDFRHQMLVTQTNHLDAILFTHPHKDHMAGLDDIRAYNYTMQQPMQLFANALTSAAIQRDFYYAFAENKYPGVPEMNINTIDLTPFEIGDIPIKPIEVMHHQMPVFGYRFGNFTYITDANFISDTEKEKILGSEILVLNTLRKEAHISHFTLQQAVTLATELAVPKVYFTHISHQLGKHDEVNAVLPSHMQLAYDGLTLQIS